MSTITRSILVVAAAISVVAAGGYIAEAARVNPPGPVHKYATRLHKGDDHLNTGISTFIIPDGQCSRVLDDALVCTHGSASRGVKVGAEDNLDYPRVRISSDLRQATVLRVAPCSGPSMVKVQLACAILGPTA